MSAQAKVALNTRCMLGEGLHWDSRRNLLWFVDIHGPRVYWFDPDSLASGSRAIPESVGWILSVENSYRMLIGLKSGIALIDPFDSSAQIQWLSRRFPADVNHRLNDGKADKKGRLWYGSVSAVDESQAVGCLATRAPGEEPIIVDSGYQVTNGPAFPEDCTYMLHSDSALRTTYKFDIDPEDGRAFNRTVWKQFDKEDGAPDGMNFDAEGCVWIAHWGAAKVCRYNSRGTLVLSIAMPTTNMTNVCFGGRDMNRLFATSATQGLSDTQKNSETAAGALLEISGTNARGFPAWRIRI